MRVIAISVDPAHDTPRAVGAFARSHALVPQFRYVVGSKSELQPVWQGYNLIVQPRERRGDGALGQRAADRPQRQAAHDVSVVRRSSDHAAGPAPARAHLTRGLSAGASVALGHRRT